MQIAFNWLDPAPLRQPLISPPAPIAALADVDASVLPRLPPSVEAAVWRAKEVGHASTAVVASGWAALDQELPGGG